MRSRVDRRLLERVLRTAGLAGLGLLLVQAWRADGTLAPMQVVPAGALTRALAAMPLTAETLGVRTDTALDPVTSAWLASRRDAGSPVRWGAPAAIPAFALAIEPSLDPGGGVRALVAAPAGRGVRLADDAGALDSARVTAVGESFAMAAPVGTLVARVDRSAARAFATLPPRIRSVVVLARAGWESKFLTAALEERGWPVEMRLAVRPDTAVVQGSPARFDTTRVGVVIALDASAAPAAPAIEAFVRSGGGLVLGPEAAAHASFAGLRPGPTGARRASAAIVVSAADPRRALPLVPVEELTHGALALERRDGMVAVAARRLGAGRALQVGYEDTWRWRMTGPDGAREAHRRWWAALVASASPDPSPEATDSASVTVSASDAPLARMVAELGVPDPAIAELTGSTEPAGPLGWWWGVLALLALLGEWASRRLRGVA